MRGTSDSSESPCGTFNSSTMIVMMMAITPSLNASSRPLPMPPSIGDRWPALWPSARLAASVAGEAHPHLESRPCIAHFEGRAVRLCDQPREVQPEPDTASGASTGRVGSIERLGDLRQHRLVQPRAEIAHREHDAPVRAARYSQHGRLRAGAVPHRVLDEVANQQANARAVQRQRGHIALDLEGDFLARARLARELAQVRRLALQRGVALAE